MTTRTVEPIPLTIEGYGQVRPYGGQPLTIPPESPARTGVESASNNKTKVLASINSALDACELKSGATISFHHHLRNGDHVLNMVLDAVAARGIENLTIAASSLFPVHQPLIEHIRRGVVTRLYTAYMSGPVADAISLGLMNCPVVMQTHGGRARAIECGDLHIDVAFIAAPSADRYGNLNGVEGPSACGPLGYAMVDAQHADRVVAITDCLVPYPACPIDIAQDRVDFVVPVDSIGNPQGILSGTTRPTSDPLALKVAATAGEVIEAAGLLQDGFSFQTGAGGVSIAVAGYVREIMHRKRVRGSFGAGGVTGYLVDMLEEGLFRTLFDVQCFDLKAVESYKRDFRHQSMSASMYANPHSRGAVVDQLDVMILGAAEIDCSFNVNVTTGSTGRILGGSGGHSDTAAGSKLAIVTTRLGSAGGRKLVENVGCKTTPGETVDVLVTEVGVAVNPRRGELSDQLISKGIDVYPIEVLCELAKKQGGSTPPPAPRGRIVGVVEYRDGTVIDVIRAIGN